MTNAIFLDIDGVLNSSRSVHVKIGPDITSEAVLSLSAACDGLPYGCTFGLRTVDPIAVALLNELLYETKASLVLSSSHRKYFADGGLTFGSFKHLDLLRQYLTVMGIRVPEDFGITPELHSIRGNEVQAYVQTVTDIEDYVILDDGRDFFDHQPLVWCDPEVGFSFPNYAEACKKLRHHLSSILF